MLLTQDMHELINMLKCANAEEKIGTATPPPQGWGGLSYETDGDAHQKF